MPFRQTVILLLSNLVSSSAEIITVASDKKRYHREFFIILQSTKIVEGEAVSFKFGWKPKSSWVTNTTCFLNRVKW